MNCDEKSGQRVEKEGTKETTIFPLFKLNCGKNDGLDFAHNFDFLSCYFLGVDKSIDGRLVIGACAQPSQLTSLRRTCTLHAFLLRCTHLVILWPTFEAESLLSQFASLSSPQ